MGFLQMVLGKQTEIEEKLSIIKNPERDIAIRIARRFRIKTIPKLKRKLEVLVAIEKNQKTKDLYESVIIQIQANKLE